VSGRVFKGVISAFAEKYPKIKNYLKNVRFLLNVHGWFSQARSLQVEHKETIKRG